MIHRFKPTAACCQRIPVCHICCAAAQQPLAAVEKPRKTPRLKLLEVCRERFPEYDERVLLSLIIQGKVLAKDTPVFKPGTLVSRSVELRIKGVPCKFVSRAGLKLDAALQHFGVDVSGKVVLDAGMSTGGFADCLLRRGAAKVYGVDVGVAQAAEQLRCDPRMVVMDRTNLRHMRASDLPERPQLVTLDLSFISLLAVMPAVKELLAPGGQLVLLIKPQFEAAKHQVQPGGIVEDEAVHREVIARVTDGIEALGFRSHGVCDSPVRGAVGKNKEFLMHASLAD